MRQNRKLLSQLLIFLNVTSSQDTQEKWKEKHQQLRKEDMKVVLFNGNMMVHLRKAKNVQGKELIFENKCKRAMGHIFNTGK